MKLTIQQEDFLNWWTDQDMHGSANKELYGRLSIVEFNLLINVIHKRSYGENVRKRINSLIQKHHCVLKKEWKKHLEN